MLLEMEDDLPQRIREVNTKIGEYARVLVLISFIALFCNLRYQAWQHEREVVRWENANIPIKAC
jgi:hypothetical protein